MLWLWIAYLVLALALVLLGIALYAAFARIDVAHERITALCRRVDDQALVIRAIGEQVAAAATLPGLNPVDSCRVAAMLEGQSIDQERRAA